MELNFRLFVIIASEMFGTGMLLLFGCMGQIATEGYARTHADMLVAFGLTVMIAIHVFGPISTSHINPSVTTAVLILGHIKWDLALLYYVSQIIGGLCGYSLLYFLIPGKYFHANNGLCLASNEVPIELGQIVLGEFLSTAVLIFVVAGVLDKRSAQFLEGSSMRFGFLVAGLLFCEAAYTGTSMNLARSLPPLIFHGGWNSLWAYAVGQFAAVIIVSLLWRFVFVNPFEKKEIEE